MRLRESAYSKLPRILSKDLLKSLLKSVCGKSGSADSLRKLIMTRFRGVSESQEVLFDDYNIIVGQNDSGKSTILKALDLFLNDSEASSDIKNTSSDDNNVEIELYFSPNNKPIIIDEAIQTSFEAEEFVNEDGFLVVKKVWDTTKTKMTPDVFLRRKSYTDHDFILLTETMVRTVFAITASQRR